MDRKKGYKILITTLILVVIILIVFLLLGIFAKNEYKVTFIDSIDKSKISVQTVKKNEKVNKPNDPIKDGYTFLNWYYNDEIYDFNTKVKNNMEIEARFSKAEEIVFKTISLNLKVDETKNLEIISLPKGLSIDDLIWSSSDENILSVDKNGKIKALKEGEATVTVKSKDGLYTSTCKVKVTKDVVAVESVSISGPNSVNVGSSIKLTVKIVPDNATDKVVKWESSNNSIATVDQEGNVKGVKDGNVTISVTTNDGSKTATYKVTVKAKSSGTKPSTPTPSTPQENEPPKTYPVESVSISGPNSVNVGASITLKATLYPSNATNKNVRWESDNDSIATVDQSGNVRGVSNGTVTIKVTTVDGSKTATYEVTVKSVYEIHLHKIQLTSDKDAQYTKVVYENGKVFTDYEFFSIGGGRVTLQETYVKSSLTGGGTIKEASIRVKGVSYFATVIYE